MEYKVKNIVATLKDLPPPQSNNEILRVVIKEDAYYIFNHNNAAICDGVSYHITLRSRKYMEDCNAWFEWVIDI